MRWRPALAVMVACALSLFSLFNVFDGRAFIAPALMAIVLVVAGAELANTLRFPALLVPFFCAALILGFLTVAFAPGGAHVFVIPGAGSFHTFAALARQGFSDIRDYATPVPTASGLVLLTVVGVAMVALVTHLLAVTLGRPAVAGLPLLALYMVGSAVAPHGVGGWGFIAVVAGYLLLLASEGRDRVLRWGKVVAGGSGESLGAPRPGAGLRIGSLAVVAAMLVPAVLPYLHAHRFSSGSGGTGNGAGSGGQIATTFNPILRLRSQLDSSSAQVLLEVRTTDPNPDYLQLTTLDTYTDDSWVASRDLEAGASARVSNGMPQPSLAGLSYYPVSDRISVVGRALSVRWLPIPYPATSVAVRGDWRYDISFATVFSAATTTASVGTYRVQSIHLTPTPGQLAAAALRGGAGLAEYLQLPPNLPSVISDIARRVAGSQTTELGQAQALQAYFQGKQFHYSTQVADNDGVDALVEFLTKTHTGFCVQYASAMAVMARALGIPARVAVGFTAGTPQRDGTWVITTHDAHAWPELYFPGAGWLRFEPTPRADGQAVSPAYTVPASAAPAPGGNPAPGGAGPAAKPSPAAGLPHQLLRIRALPGVHDSATTSAAARHGSAGTGALLPVLVILLIGAAVPAVVRRVVSGARARAPAGPARAEAAWAELADRVVDYRLPWLPSDTPRRAADRLAQAAGWGPAECRPLDRLVAAVEVARYAPAGAVLPDPRPELRRTLRLLGEHAGWQGRWRSRLAPRSTGRLIVDEAWGLADRLGRRLRRPSLARPRPGSSSAATLPTGL
jgi:transglutaminase-like putative cysteine protease